MTSLMIQGTSSDAGKSAVVAGLCRLLARRGVRVAPFKPQNMALNSAVTIDGGEIGRAQAVQAQAAGLEPHTDMNPVLLKPSTEVGAQVIVHGKVLTQMDARDYHAFKPRMMAPVLESFRRLRGQYDLVLVEGAGSPAEINLRDGDLANMGFAEAADCPVWLLGDIDRGGVFAQLIGTMELLSASEQARIEAFVINRFRGDVSLLDPGLEYLTERTGIPVIGVLPYLEDFHLEAEDSLSRSRNRAAGSVALRVAVPVLPRMSNHTDLDPLALHPRVELDWVEPGQAIPGCDLIILPGSKSVRQDLQRLSDEGWAESIYRHLRYGGRVLGLCGGYQMLGSTVRDPEGIEGPPGSGEGLGLLSVETTLEADKQLRRVSGHLTIDDAQVDGYEIHMGTTVGADLQRPLVRLPDRTDGAISEDGLVMGTYLHGLLEAESARRAILAWAGLRDAAAPDYRSIRDQAIDRLADMLERHLDAEVLSSLVDHSHSRLGTQPANTHA